MSDYLRATSAFTLVVTASFWLVAASRVDEFGFIIQGAAVTLAACFAFVELNMTLFPSLKRPYITMHFGMGLCQMTLYIAAYLWSVDVFEKIWSSVFFGYYLWTFIVIVSRPSELFYRFRLFFTVHHSLSFIVTGTWLLVSPCCEKETYLLRSIMLWFSGGLWAYTLNVVRSVRPDIDIAVIRRAQLAVFCVERVHKSSSYISGLAVTGGVVNTLDWLVLSTGIFMDASDVAFQVHSLRKVFGKEGMKDSGDKKETTEKDEATENVTERNDIESNTLDPRAPPTTATRAGQSQVVGRYSIFHEFTRPPPKRLASKKCDGTRAGPFVPVPLLEGLLSDPIFDKTTQWELTAVKFQKLTRDRLRLLASTGAFRISQCPGMDSRQLHAPGAFTRLLEAFHFVGMYDLSLFDVLGVHAAGGNVVFSHGSDCQLSQHHERIDSITDVYCLGGMEIAHGSTLRQTQTVAHFERNADGFVLDTPSAAGCKYWIGNSTFVADYVVVLCRIIIRGQECGLGWFRVPLWEETESGEKVRYPGVEVRDTGTSSGCNGVGNGCIEFEHVRLPRDALLTRFCKVDTSGNFHSDLTPSDLSLRCIQTFVLERIAVTTAAIGSAKVALFVALKYAGARHHFGPGGIQEVPLITYPMQQRRLMSHAARLFVAKALVDRIGESAEATYRPFEFDANRKALHALSCMAKAFGSWEAFDAAQEARECCGRRAFAAVSQIGMLRNDLDVTLTFAGDNSLLALEVVRFRLEQVKEWTTLKSLMGPARPLFWYISVGDSNDPTKLFQKVIEAVTFREEEMLFAVEKKMRGSDGNFDRFTRYSYEMREVASAVYDRMCVMTWFERQLSRSALHDELGMLDAVLRIEKHASWYMAQGIMSVSTLKSIEKIIVSLCNHLGEKYKEVMAAFYVPDELVKNWPLVHDDYCQRMRDLTYACPGDAGSGHIDV